MPKSKKLSSAALKKRKQKRNARRINNDSGCSSNNDLSIQIENNTNDPSNLTPHFPFNLTSEQIDLGNQFDIEMKLIDWKYCSNCEAALPEMKLVNNLCHWCKKDPLLFHSSNGFDFGDYPEYLPKLNDLEEMLIALNHVCLTIYRAGGKQYKYSGHVINFPQNIRNYVDKLPHPPEKIPYYIVFEKNSKSGTAQYKVCANHILLWLQWLTKNNPYYSTIEIDMDQIASLQETEDISDRLPKIELDCTENSVENYLNSFVPDNITINEDSVMVNELKLPYPTLVDRPVNEFSEVGYLACAFPTLLPYGIGDINDSRKKPVKTLQYFQYCMRVRGGRFAKHARFRYVALNTIQRHRALSSANLFVKGNDFEKKTIKEIQSAIEENENLVYNIASFSGGLRGTRVYWRKRATELMSMVKQLGQPHLFITLSAADYHWPDLMRLLGAENEGINLTETERTNLMHENPLIVGQYFYIRSQSFMSQVVKPLFNVKDFWFRYEWQSRGSPHLHGVLWLNDAVQINKKQPTEEELIKLKTLFQELSFAWNIVQQQTVTHPSRIRFSEVPNGEKENDLINLLNTFQRHTTCSQKCLRKIKKTGKYRCRYRFPKECRSKAIIEKDDDYYQFHPSRNDPIINRYHPLITMIWRANTDISAIIGLDKLMHYIVKYVSKAEKPSQNLVDVLKGICKDLDNDDPARKAIHKLFLKMVGERDYSAQEVYHLLMGWNLIGCSRSFATINCHENAWNKAEIDEESQTLELKNLISRYTARPKKFESFSLLKFAREISGRGNKFNIKRIENVIRIIPDPKKVDKSDPNGNYYRIPCILHIPFRKNQETLLQKNKKEVYSNWKSLYDAEKIQDIDDIEIDADIEDFEDDEEQLDPIDDEIRQSLFEKAAGHLPFQEKDQLGNRTVDNFDWTASINNYPSMDEVHAFLKDFTNVTENDSEIMDTGDFILSVEQKEVMRILNLQLKYLSCGELNEVCNVIKPCIIQGKAGCGKSTIIKIMIARIQEILGKDKVIVAAPTGIAALNIGGITLHTAFKLKVFDREHIPLSESSLLDFRQKYGNVKFVIIDEMSMIGSIKLTQIDRRLKELTGNTEEPFGGLMVYFFGDYRQLPPIGDSAVYDSKADAVTLIGRAVFDSFQKIVELKSNHRQQNDHNFANLLERLGCNRITMSDYQMLISRAFYSIPRQEIDDFKNAITICSTKENVERTNQKELAKTGHPVVKLLAKSSNNVKYVGPSDLTGGLQESLYLSIGTKVMLTRNLWVKGGLVNGSIGYIRAIVYPKNKEPPELPDYLLVHFPNYRGKMFFNDAIPIVPIKNSWRYDHTDWDRCQFPLKVAYAITIHKSQGLTLDKVIIDLGDKEFSLGLTYVALTRAKSLNDILFWPMYNFSRFTDFSTRDSFLERSNFLQSLSQRSIIFQ